MVIKILTLQNFTNSKGSKNNIQQVYRANVRRTLDLQLPASSAVKMIRMISLSLELNVSLLNDRAANNQTRHRSLHLLIKWLTIR